MVRSFRVSQDHRPAHVDLFTQLSSNNVCSRVTHILHHKTCSPSIASCSSSNSAHVAVELDSILASAKHRESGFNRAWQDEFLWLLFTTEYAVKIRLQLQTLC